ncbi:protein of unknown function [Candidatus Methylomirabilis oxygeniifera]|uniref:Uncharacterized protein n=1 Tax=Methylomirabilis oxygeniifera TaxID=671143 RepID=D5MGT1_METO1|nr:protein of unknown function [Candidatus Methylomirabilis oxyfera]
MSKAQAHEFKRDNVGGTGRIIEWKELREGEQGWGTAGQPDEAGLRSTPQHREAGEQHSRRQRQGDS